jgi:hypothetical protein
MKLTPSEQRVVSDNLESLARAAKTTDFSAPTKAQREADSIKNALLDQKGYHRDRLIGFICKMAIASLALLAVIVLLQMIIRIWSDDYHGVSDSVVKVLTVGVFGQIIGIVASIVLAVWKDNS